jgi:hypothetical protein
MLETVTDHNPNFTLPMENPDSTEYDMKVRVHVV